MTPRGVRAASGASAARRLVSLAFSGSESSDWRASTAGVGAGGAGLTPIGVAHAAGAADQPRGPVQRVVEGKITNGADAPVKGAVVYLKDDRTLAVKTFIADDGGAYRFGQLSQTADYELWAEDSGRKSPTRSISSFDTKNDFRIDLKIK